MYILEFIKYKKYKKCSFFNISIASGILISAKTGFAIIVLPFIIHLIIQSLTHRAIQKKSLLILLLPFITICSTTFYNFYIKYNSFQSPVSSMRYLFDYEIMGRLVKLVVGFFGGSQGIFLISPIYLVSLFYLLKYLKNSFMLNRFEKSLIILQVIFFLIPTLFVIGDFFEDQFPGRTLLATLPFLFIGFSFFAKTFKYKKTFLLIMSIFSIIHIFLTVNFHLADKLGSYIYIKEFILSKFLLRTSLELNLKFIYENIQLVFTKIQLLKVYILSASICIIIFAVINNFKNSIKTFLSLILAIQVLITSLNFSNHEKNILSLRRNGFFDDKVIGSGSEIYFYDFFFDVIKNIKSRNNDHFDSLADQAVSRYYSTINNQIIQSTPAFQSIIESQRQDKTIWDFGKIYE